MVIYGNRLQSLLLDPLRNIPYVTPLPPPICPALKLKAFWRVLTLDVSLLDWKGGLGTLLVQGTWSPWKS